MKPEQLKYMEMVQAIITRMNSNSFQIKAVTMTLATAILIVFASTRNGWVIVCAFPVLIFMWIIDSYYLQHERKYRDLYNDLVKDINSKPLFCMSIKKYRGCESSLLSSMILSVNGFIYFTLICFFVTLKIIA